MSSPASSVASSADRPSVSTTYPTTQPASPMSLAHHEHTLRLAREQQQMIEELMSSGLVQAADLLAFGFSEAEINAAGFHLTAPHHSEEEGAAAAAAAASAAVKTTHVDDGSADDRRAKARKRTWQDEQRVESNVGTPMQTVPASTSEPHTAVGHTQEPTTAAKAVDGVVSALSEQHRVGALRSARVVEQHLAARPSSADDCVRALRFDAEEDVEECATTTTTTTTTAFSHPAMGTGAAAHPTRRVNTALGFSGTDVAVAKEIALLLQTPIDEDERVERLRTLEYLDSRLEGNTPYM